MVGHFLTLWCNEHFRKKTKKFWTNLSQGIPQTFSWDAPARHPHLCVASCWVCLPDWNPGFALDIHDKVWGSCIREDNNNQFCVTSSVYFVRTWNLSSKHLVQHLYNWDPQKFFFVFSPPTLCIEILMRNFLFQLKKEQINGRNLVQHSTNLNKKPMRKWSKGVL